jgi:hypothetical protein
MAGQCSVTVSEFGFDPAIHFKLCGDKSPGGSVLRISLSKSFRDPDCFLARLQRLVAFSGFQVRHYQRAERCHFLEIVIITGCVLCKDLVIGLHGIFERRDGVFPVLGI